MPEALRWAPGTCPVCGESFDRSMITGCRLDTFDHFKDDALIYGGTTGQAGIHLHGVVIAAHDALTVRGSLRRWRHQGHFRIGRRLRRMFHFDGGQG